MNQLNLYKGLALAGWLLLSSCGGGGGGDRATDVGAGPPPPGTPPPVSPVPPGPNPPTAYAQAQQLNAFVTDVGIGADGRPRVDFSVADDNNTALDDVTAEDVRFIIAKLTPGELGNLQGTWQSYINRIEQPGVGPGSVPRLQAETEAGSSGSFTNNGDGTYRYVFDQAITDLGAFDPAIVAQAREEGLDLSYDPTLTHRVSMQFSGSEATANPSYDFQPASGATEQILHGQVVATESCNACHDTLAFHGGGRVETDYCVTCHNPGTTDANSTNSMAFDVLTHKLHYGANLPSVEAGQPYQIYGFRDSLVDYSNVHYPQDPGHCTSCHAGSATDDGNALATANGDNWNEYPTQSGCGSCHDDVDFTSHFGNQSDDTNCRSCHAQGAIAGSPAESHADQVLAASEAYRFDILDVANSGPGQQPRIDFQVVDPTNNDAPYDVLNDPPFTQEESRVAVTLGWSTDDYTNSGNNSPTADTVVIEALADAVDLGAGVFRVTSPVPIPDGSAAPFIAATGSGAATVEGHVAEDFGTTTPDVKAVPVINALTPFSIDEPDGEPVPRRNVADVALCADCHSALVVHGENRRDNLQACATCHNPRGTDREVRPLAVDPPTDGKTEESIDFKTMIHGIHASAVRENQLQIVGFRGFSTARYTEEEVQYPGRLANCKGCHVEDSFALPLADSVLGTTVNSGADQQDPTDDTVISPATAVCNSCHDGAVAKAHMQSNGGSFATTQALLDEGAVVEQCALCHRPGGTADVNVVHGLR